MFRRLVLLIGFFVIALPMSAQLDTNDFRWDFADLAFSYPASWDEPFAVQRFGIESVIFAESDTRDAERDPEIPFVVFALQPDVDTDVNTILQEKMTELELQSDVTIASTLLDQPATWTQGHSRDESFFGMGMSTALGDQILSVVGRSPSEQTAQFQYIFDVVTRSLVKGGEFGQVVSFGIVWDNSALVYDGNTAFTDLRAIAIDEPSQSVYALDDSLGLLRFDSLSGRLESIIQNIEFVSPNTIAIGIDQTIYVGDSSCRCVHVYRDGIWEDALDGFSEDAPFSILATTDGNFYATDSNDALGFVRRFNAEGTTNLFSEEPLEDQPLLFSADGELQLFNQNTDQILALDGIGFTLVATLDIESSPQYIQQASDGTYVLADGDIIELYTPDSLLIDSVDINDYSLGSIIRGFALGRDNTLYIASIGDDVGEVLALSQRVSDISQGLQILAPYRNSRGFLNADNPEDIWLIDGTRGDILSLFVQGSSSLSDFDFSMTLIAPDGTELITIDESMNGQSDLSRGFLDYELPDTGFYEIHVNHLFSQGNYDITQVALEQFTLNPTRTTVWGELSDSYSQEMWVFEATAGTTVTLTLRASDPNQLDPYIILYDAQYNLLGQNDDADDSQLGNSAQIERITLSRNGLYYVDALRLTGEGKYSLTVDVVEPE